MISVSRAAGYGKFTQTNDSHLPEAKGHNWGVSGGGGGEGKERGEDPKRQSRDFRSLHLHEGNCSPFHLWDVLTQAAQEPWTTLVAG